jgi:hypothetical protein
MAKSGTLLSFLYVNIGKNTDEWLGAITWGAIFTDGIKLD